MKHLDVFLSFGIGIGVKHIFWPLQDAKIENAKFAIANIRRMKRKEKQKWEEGLVLRNMEKPDKASWAI